MLNYKIHDNGWTVLADIDLKTSTQEDINAIAKLAATNAVVVFKKQFLTVEEEVRILRMFKNPTPLYDKDNPLFPDYAIDPDGLLCRVTAELRDGKPGMGGDRSTFDWHVDSPQVPNRNDILYLRGVRGTEGSRTSWNNNLLAYNDLDSNMKNTIVNLHCIYGNIYAPWAPDFVGIRYNYDWTPSIIHQNVTGQTGMYFAPDQMAKFVELSQEESDRLKEILSAHILSDKYVYHHDWEDGDLIISDQWNGLHKRWEFDKMDIRVMYRASADYPEQDYTA
jgi:alpha-ketoglutarate-dependent taurine dioxygenase